MENCETIKLELSNRTTKWYRTKRKKSTKVIRKMEGLLYFRYCSVGIVLRHGANRFHLIEKSYNEKMTCNEKKSLFH